MATSAERNLRFRLCHLLALGVGPSPPCRRPISEVHPPLGGVSEILVLLADRLDPAAHAEATAGKMLLVSPHHLHGRQGLSEKRPQFGLAGLVGRLGPVL